MKDAKDLMICLFCDKSLREVKKMISAKKEGVYICNECIELSIPILAADGWVPPWIKIKTVVEKGECIHRENCKCNPSKD
jgi:ATP-dependent protease Clp ATPase subunit